MNNEALLGKVEAKRMKVEALLGRVEAKRMKVEATCNLISTFVI